MIQTVLFSSSLHFCVSHPRVSRIERFSSRRRSRAERKLEIKMQQDDLNDEFTQLAQKLAQRACRAPV